MSARQFIGGSLDGIPADVGRRHWYITADGEAYALRDGRFVYVGVECAGCRSVVQPGDGAQVPESCPLCGADVPALL